MNQNKLKSKVAKRNNSVSLACRVWSKSATQFWGCWWRTEGRDGTAWSSFGENDSNARNKVTNSHGGNHF